MKKYVAIVVFFLVFGAELSAGVIKKTRVEVDFKGFGKFSVLSEEKISAERSFSQSKNDFKGQGLVGGLAGKTILRSGDFGQIINLPERLIYQLDNKKKEYTVLPIEKFKEQELGETEEKEPEAGGEESELRIIRSEFKVEPTSEQKVINQFNCRKYLITWLTEWENVRTGERGKEKLLTEVWATPLTGALQEAQEEEARFATEYMKLLGLEFKGKEKDILGESWLNLLSQLKAGEEAPLLEAKNVAKELKKIEGFPVVTSGQLFSSREGGESEPKSEGRPGGLVGGLAKSVLKKKPKEGEEKEPALTYYIEVMEVNLVPLKEADFQVPPDYKKKN